MEPTNKSPRLLIVVTALLGFAFLGALVFGIWAFTGRSDYKNNSDKIADAAVQKALADQKVALQAQYDEQSKLPNKIYKGDPTYGSVTFNYPKTWSGYVYSATSSQPLDAYFYPDVVPGGNNNTTAFALRVELVNQDYASVLTGFDSGIRQGTLTSKAYVPPKMSTLNVQPGVRLDGAISQGKNGAMVIMKVRDKTLKVYTESNDFMSDFNNVLSSLTFTP